MIKAKDCLRKAGASVVDITKKISGYVVPIVVAAVCEQALSSLKCRTTISFTSNPDNDIYCRCDYDYAIEAIVDSTMCSGDKTRAIAKVKSGKEEAYYRSIASIADSVMCSHDRCEAIGKVGEDYR